MYANRNSYIANTHEETQSLFLLLDKRSDRLTVSLLEPEIFLNKRDRKISADNEDDNIAKTVQLMKNKKIAKGKKDNADNIQHDDGEGMFSRFNGRINE